MIINKILAPAASILIALSVTSGVHGQTSPLERSGSIMINIHNVEQYVEFHVENGHLNQTDKGPSLRFEKDGVTHVKDESDSFRKAYYTEQLYRYEMEACIEQILSKLDLVKFEELLSDFIIREKADKSRTILTGPGKKPQSMWGKYADHFYPNRQLSHLIYYHYSFAGALIDLSTREVSFPFGLDGLMNLVWSNDGKYVAYSVLDENDQSILVIKDIVRDKTILRKNIGKYPYDITWSPDSSHIAVLTSTRRLGIWPWELLSAAAGHPYYYITFFTEVYDTTGKLIFSKKAIGGFKNGTGKIVWSP